MVEIVTDLEVAKQQLYDGTMSVYEFDQLYGQGAADDVMRGTYRTPDEIAAAEAEEQGNQNFIQRTGAVLADIGQGIADGVEEAINETAQTIDSAGEALEDKLGVGRLVFEDKDGDGKTDLIPSYWSREKVVANKDKLVAGLALESVIKGVKFVALSRKANTEIKQLGEVTDETADQLDEVHAEAAEVEESIATNKDDALVARPDGTFEAPDGTIYQPDGDTLTEVSRAADEAVPTNVDELEQPTAPENAPDAIPEASVVKADVQSEAPTQPEVPIVEVEVAPVLTSINLSVT